MPNLDVVPTESPGLTIPGTDVPYTPGELLRLESKLELIKLFQAIRWNLFTTHTFTRPVGRMNQYALWQDYLDCVKAAHREGRWHMKRVLLLALFFTALASPAQVWLDGIVVAVGHTTSDYGGRQIPTATVVLADPGNSNPDIRLRVLVVTMQAQSWGKTHVDLSLKDTRFKAYETGRDSLGPMQIRYTDDKGHVKSEGHAILNELGLDALANCHCLPPEWLSN